MAIDPKKKVNSSKVRTEVKEINKKSEIKEETNSAIRSKSFLQGSYLTDTKPVELQYINMLKVLSEAGTELVPVVNIYGNTKIKEFINETIDKVDEPEEVVMKEPKKNIKESKKSVSAKDEVTEPPITSKKRKIEVRYR